MSAAGDIADPGARQRYSDRPFPSYRFVPGVRPHPTRDPAGHSHESGTALRRHPKWEPREWQTLDAWLYGVDLFNAHYFWEAHESWEGLWAARPRESPTAIFLQGLIQLAAALLKIHLQSLEGASSLAAEALRKLRAVADAQGETMGLDLGRCIADFDAYLAPLRAGVLPSLRDAPELGLVTA